MPAPLNVPAKFIVERRKITNYLLDISHPDGSAKAVFFLQRGFSPANVEEFARRLLDHPLLPGNVLTKVTHDLFAPRFTFEGRLICPDGSEPHVRSVWELRPGDSHGRLVTSYPCKPAAGATIET